MLPGGVEALLHPEVQGGVILLERLGLPRLDGPGVRLMEHATLRFGKGDPERNSHRRLHSVAVAVFKGGSVEVDQSVVMVEQENLVAASVKVLANVMRRAHKSAFSSTLINSLAVPALSCYLGRQRMPSYMVGQF